jgi:hypothetical protein
MSEYRKIADSTLDYLTESRLFGIPLIELLQTGLDTTLPDTFDLAEIMEGMPKRPLYEKENP